ncbi:MAG: nucleotidyltransferase domain-containing protein [Clostridiales bacterium]|nr:nucleotidyltransferase domain-containing protein [Clostridiales bacterium]
MFQPDQYISSLIHLLKAAFQQRLIFVGLQGSYLRGEATEHSDIDVMVVIHNLTADDLTTYRNVISALPDSEKSCGFICGLEELQHWNPLEICHLLYTTKTYYGQLEAIIPSFTRQHVCDYVKLSVGNLYHEICHRHIHAPVEVSKASLPGACKQVFFILQNLHYAEHNNFIPTRKELLAALSGEDRWVLQTALSLGGGAAFDYDETFSLLLGWCQKALVRVSNIAQNNQ